MHIVGFSGPINHGKTTASKYLMTLEPKSTHFESWEIIAEVAEKLNSTFDPNMVRPSDLTSVNSWLYHLLEILPETVNVRPTFDKIEIREHEVDSNHDLYEKLFIYIDRLLDNPGLAKEEIETTNKEVHRPILQWLGAYLAHNISGSIWFDEIMRRVDRVRDKYELVTVAAVRFPADAATLRKHGGLIIEIVRPDYERAEISDPTEKFRDQISPDCSISNNGNLDHLEKVMKAVWEDIKEDRLRYEYSGIN